MATTPDFVTGKLVDSSKPEESVRQDFEKLLVNSYNYPKDHIDIEVRIQRGSSYFKERADIVIYDGTEANGRDSARDILGIIECKRPGTTSGMDQLKSYMTATSAKWGVCTNGTDLTHVCRDPRDPTRLLDDYLFNMPVFGQNIEDVGKLVKSQLAAFDRDQLKIVFRRILNKLYANSQIARRDRLGTEMVKLIFAKIEDELTYPNRPPDFRVQLGESPEDVASRINALFSQVVRKQGDDKIFNPNDTISLDAESVVEVVGQMEGYSLTKTDTDVVGDAFEVFAESRLAGEKGQFFTPRGVVRLAVTLSDPKPEERVCDPACGSGGFLIGAMQRIWELMDEDPTGKYGTGTHLDTEKKRIAAGTLYGVDKEVDLIKIAKAYMAIAGDGRSYMRRADSLSGTSDDTNKFDIVLTNPPFGTKSKVNKELSAAFELGHKWNNKDGEWCKGGVVARDPYVLFIERCVEITRRGGRIVIVLPESVLHAPSLAYVRNYIRSIGSVDAIIDLPHNSFRPHCNAKTCLLSIQKDTNQASVIMATPQEMGHDLQGKPLYREANGTEITNPTESINKELWDDLAEVEAELGHPADSDNKHTFLAEPETIADECWVPRYHRSLVFPPRLPDGCVGVTLGEMVDNGTIFAVDGHGSPKAVEKGRGTVPYVRVADIVNWELYHNPVAGVPESERQRLKADKRPPQVNDIVLVRRGSYRIGTVAMVGPRDTNAVLTRELLTLRVHSPNTHKITPYYLLAMLSTESVQQQIPPKVCVDTTLPNLGDRWRTVVVPVHNAASARARISDQVEQIIQRRREAWDETSQLSEQIGSLIT